MKPPRSSTIEAENAQMPRVGPDVRLKLWVLAGLFAAFTAVGAWMRIPTPTGVPLSLQTVFVLLAGGILGPRYGALSQLLYLGVGLLGAPVFAEGGGLGYIARPTFGYLLAFPVAAFLVGVLSHPRSPHPVRYRRLVGANALGVAVIFLFGVSFLYAHFRYVAGSPLSWTTAAWIGAVVFLPGDLVKVLIAALLQQRLAPVLNRQVGATTVRQVGRSTSTDEATPHPVSYDRDHG